MTSETVAYLKRVADQAGKRGEWIIGYYGNADGSYFRFEFAKIKRGRAARPPAEDQRRVTRGVVPAPAQGSML